MKIVRDKVGHIARYAFDAGAEVSISEFGLTGPGVRALDITSSDHEIVTAPALGIFAPGVMAYDGSAWTIVDPAAYEASPALASATALIGEVKAAINDHIEATARSKQYDGAVAISTYVNSTVPAWAAEALAFVAWRDAVWIYAVGALDSVLGGHRAAPSVEEFLAELPAMEWPA